MADLCPCSSGLPFSGCCGPLLDGFPAPTAVALMRSRYSAYARGAIDHLVASHDPATRDDVDREGCAKWSREAEWVGLEIVDTVAGGEGDDEGVVEFIARYRMGGVDQQVHERSRFARKDGRWYYIDGEMVKRRPLVREAPKVGRNDPCPCKSGKKYKQCCGR